MAVLNDYQRRLLTHLQSFLTPARLQRFSQVLDRRTRWLTLALWDIHLSHNISAVLRSCDACGVQDVHVVESYNPFEANREITLGADQWLTVKRFRGERAPELCLNSLHQAGYRIVATSPRADSCPIDELPIDRPMALLFGGEKAGLDPHVIAQADRTAFLPMVGFVESFNISVAAALFLFHLSSRIRCSNLPWQLSEAEKELLLFDWVRTSVPHLEPIERRFRDDWERGASPTGPAGEP